MVLPFLFISFVNHQLADHFVITDNCIGVWTPILHSLQNFEILNVSRSVIANF